MALFANYLADAAKYFAAFANHLAGVANYLAQATNGLETPVFQGFFASLKKTQKIEKF
tara:strand:- start:847 stop:1020 length:174 start_codon:yes stop_codon:yes gene_type:complete